MPPDSEIYSEQNISLSEAFIFVFYENMVLLGLTIVIVSFFVYQLNRKKKQIRMQQQVLDQQLDGVLIFEDDGRLGYINQKAMDIMTIFAYQSDHKLSLLKDYLDLFFDYAYQLDSQMMKLLARIPGAEKGQNNFYTEVIRSEEGLYYFVQGHKTHLGQTYLKITDVTQHQKQESYYHRLDTANHQLFQAIEATSSCIALVAQHVTGYRVVFANSSFCNMIGMNHEEARHMLWRDILQMFNSDAEGDLDIQALLENEGPNEDIDHNLILDNETGRYYYNLKTSSVLSENRGDDYFVAVFTDMTELKVREGQMFQAQKLEALGRLSGGIAHDFNNILSIIDGYAVMTAKRLKDTGFAGESLEKISKAAKRGASLTKRMLAFSKNQVVTKSVYDMRSILEEQERYLRPILDPNINFAIYVPSEPMPVECDQDSAAQILLNLVMNASESMPSGGSIDIHLYEKNAEEVTSDKADAQKYKAYVCLLVQDTGEGMEERVLSQVFDPFFSTKKADNAAGLGLSLVYGTVESMDGFIEVETKLDEGTEFCIYMPKSEKVHKAKFQIDSAIDRKTMLRGYTILVVDDEEDLVAISADLLRGMSANVLEATSGDMALDIMDAYEGEIDLLLTDIVMPDLNGVRLAELFVSLSPQTKVIFMSGYPSGKYAGKIDLPKDTPLLVKPVGAEKITAVIMQALGQGEAEKTNDDEADQWSVQDENSSEK